VRQARNVHWTVLGAVPPTDPRRLLRFGDLLDGADLANMGTAAARNLHSVSGLQHPVQHG